MRVMNLHNGSTRPSGFVYQPSARIVTRTGPCSSMITCALLSFAASKRMMRPSTIYGPNDPLIAGFAASYVPEPLGSNHAVSMPLNFLRLIPKRIAPVSTMILSSVSVHESGVFGAGAAWGNSFSRYSAGLPRSYLPRKFTCTHSIEPSGHHAATGWICAGICVPFSYNASRVASESALIGNGTPVRTGHVVLAKYSCFSRLMGMPSAGIVTTGLCLSVLVKSHEASGLAAAPDPSTNIAFARYLPGLSDAIEMRKESLFVNVGCVEASATLDS